MSDKRRGVMPLTAQVTTIVLLMGILSVRRRGNSVAHPAIPNTHTARAGLP